MRRPIPMLGKLVGIGQRRAGSGGTDGGDGFVGVDADEFVIAVRADVADGQGGVGGEFALDAQRPGDQRGRLHVGLNAAGDQLGGGGNRSGGIDREVCETRKIGDAVGRIERRVLIGAIAERVLKIVVHAEAGADHGFVCRTGLQARAMRGCGRNFALLVVKKRAADARRGGNDAVGEGVVGGAAVSFVPAGGEFIAKTERQRELGADANHIFGVERAEPGAPVHRGGSRIVEEGADVPPGEMCVRLAKVACPNWLSAMISFD